MKKIFVIIFIFSTAFIVSAKEEDLHQHDAHEHGVAEMSIAWVKHELTFDIETPAHNFVGFEHQPKSRKKKKIVKKVAKLLKQPNQLFSLDNSSCQVEETKIDSPFESIENDHDHGHDHGHKHGSEKHSDEKKDSHKDHSEHDDHNEETHSEYSLHYRFDCTELKESLTVDLAPIFNQFPNLENLKVQWLSETKQFSKVATRNNTNLILK